MMKTRGMTLLELVLAISMLALVSLGVSVLFLSITRTSMQVEKGIRSQSNLDKIFQDMEMNFRDLMVVNDSSMINLCGAGASTETPVLRRYTFGGINMSSPAVCATTGPSGYTAWINNHRFDIWLRGLRKRKSSAGAEVLQKVGYGFRFYEDPLNSRKFKTAVVRCIVDLPSGTDVPCDDSNTVVLAYGIQPYADADKDNNGIFDATEVYWRDTNCISPTIWKAEAFTTATLPTSKCNSVSMIPVFKISPTKKFFTVSLSTGEMESQGSGVTKAFYLHETQG